jgi:hypothetical protein
VVGSLLSIKSLMVMKGEAHIIHSDSDEEFSLPLTDRRSQGELFVRKVVRLEDLFRDKGSASDK